MKKKTDSIQQLLLLSIITLMLTTGCTSKVATVSAPIALPSSFSQSGTEEVAPKWWLAFNDPSLNMIIEQALRDNFSLMSSWDRLH